MLQGVGTEDARRPVRVVEDLAEEDALDDGPASPAGV